MTVNAVVQGPRTDADINRLSVPFVLDAHLYAMAECISFSDFNELCKTRRGLSSSA